MVSIAVTVIGVPTLNEFISSLTITFNWKISVIDLLVVIVNVCGSSVGLGAGVTVLVGVIDGVLEGVIEGVIDGVIDGVIVLVGVGVGVTLQSYTSNIIPDELILTAQRKDDLIT